MKTKFVIFGLALAGAVTVAVSSVVAQSSSQPAERQERPRMWMLDGLVVCAIC